METLILNSAVLPFLRLILIPTQMYKVLCVSNKKKFLVGWVVHTIQPSAVVQSLKK